MLAGRQAFAGEAVADVLASVLARDPPWDALPTTLDPRLAEAVRRCLAKQPRQRWQAIGDLRFELRRIAAVVYSRQTPSPLETRLDVVTGDDDSFALSPDGQPRVRRRPRSCAASVAAPI